MKKIIIMAALAMMSVAADAQTWIGGNIGLTSSTSTVKVGDVSTDKTTTDFTVAPEIGYNLDDKWSIAVKLSVTHFNSYKAAISLPFNGEGNAFTVNPYVRYTFVKVGNFTAFLDGGVAFASAHINGTSDVMDNINGVKVGINPGISYAISPRVGLVAHIGDLSYDYAWTKTKQKETTISNGTFKLNLTNAISFGAYVNL